MRSRFSKYVRQVRRNPHLFCYNDCCMDSCPKHKNRCPYDGQYLFAMLKDTPFCPHEDIETYEYYHDGEKRIAIQSGMSQAQTIKTLLHEVSHVTYHTRDNVDPEHPIDRRHKETEAESIAFCVGSALSIVDSGDYTFPYLASWASGKDTKELKDSLERIRSASDEMITAIDQSLQKQKQKSRGYER